MSTHIWDSATPWLHGKGRSWKGCLTDGYTNTHTDISIKSPSEQTGLSSLQNQGTQFPIKHKLPSVSLR